MSISKYKNREATITSKHAPSSNDQKRQSQVKARIKLQFIEESKSIINQEDTY